MRNKSIALSMMLIMLIILCIPQTSAFAADKSIKVQMYNSNTDTTSNSICPKFKIINTGSDIALSDVELRYYYTNDGEKDQKFWCDYASMTTGSNYEAITSAVDGSFVKMDTPVNNANHYVAIGFKDNAGSFKAGTQVEVLTRFAKSDWTNYDQSDDYSFNAESTQYVDWDKVAVYISGKLAYGTAPIEEPSASSSIITPNSNTFDKNANYQKDVEVKMVLNGNKLSAIKNSSATMKEGTDYTVSDNKVTIKKSYLATLSTGTALITFDFSEGRDPILNLKVIDSSEAYDGLKVQMYNSKTDASTNSISSQFKILNTGSTDVNLSDITLKYYYTIDGEKDQNFWCDYAALIEGYNHNAITSYVTGNFVKLDSTTDNADYYVEIGFKSDAGTLKAGSSVNVQARVAKSDWSNYSQTNDYSFNETSTNYVNWDKVTAYVSGELVYGTPPSEEPQVPNSTITPTSATFDKNVEKQADINVTMTLNGNTLSAIKNGTATLIKDTDYTVAGNTVTIKKSYLAALSTGTALLTFDFSKGKDSELNVKVIDTTKIDSLNVNIGSATGKAGDTVTIPISFADVSSKGICSSDFKLSYDTNLLEAVEVTAGDIVKNASVNFSSDINSTTGTISFLFLDNTLGSELITQDGVFANIKFKLKSVQEETTTTVGLKSIGAFADKDLKEIITAFKDGNITIESSGTSNSTITPTSATFDKNVEKQANINVTMTLNGNTLSAIKNGTAALIKGTDYTVSDNTVTIKKSYLAALSTGTAILTFDFSKGKDSELNVKVIDTTKTDSLNANIGSVSGKAGETVTIPVSFADVSANGICSSDFKLSYDTKLLEAVEVTAGDIVKNASVNFSSDINSTAGTISFLFLDNTLGSELITQDGVFANIKFKLKSVQEETTTTVGLKSIGAFADKDLKEITTAFKDGNITIKSSETSNSTITPASATFDKNVEKQADINVTMTLNGNTLSSIKNSEATLVKGTDYTVSDNTVTIKKSYLAALSTGRIPLTFEFSAGNAGDLSVNVVDTTVISQGLKANIGSATAVAGDTVTIPVNFISVPENGIANCDFKLSYNTDLLESVKVTAGDIVNNSSVNLSSTVNNSTGIISFLFLDNTLGSELITQDGVFANISFTVKNGVAPQTTEIKLKSVGAFGDADLKTIEVKLSDGKIQVK